MKRKSRRIAISLLLSVIMVFSMFAGTSGTAFASEVNLSVEVQTPQDLLSRSDMFDVKVIVSNNGENDASDINVLMTAPYFAAPMNTPESTIDIPAGESITINYRYTVLEGGREAFSASVMKDGVVVATAKNGVSVYGPGYYRGDNHIHTTYSDGSGSSRQNTDEGYNNKMLSWVYTTDHNTLANNASCVAETERLSGKFFNLPGNELTSYNGHALSFSPDINFIEEVVPYNLNTAIAEFDKVTGREYGNLEKWQEIADFITSRGANFYMAHPYNATLGFDNRPNVMGDDTIKDFRRYQGMEIWNGSYTNAANVQARDAWDKVNTQGTGKYSGLSVSDAHSASAVGAAYIKAYLPALTEGNIHNVLEKGNYVGSNGADIRFNIDGVNISDTLNITGNSKTANFNINVYSPMHNLVKMEIIKNTVTGNYEHNKEVAYSHSFVGENAKAFDGSIQLEVKPGEFYRVEVESEQAVTSTTRGFALTNNIWIDKADQSNATNLGNIAYSGSNMELKTLPTGTMYLIGSENTSFDIDMLSATVAEGAILTKVFDTDKQIVKLRATAADGTETITEIFILKELGPDSLFVTTDKNMVNNGEYFNVSVSFKETQSSNAAVLKYTYDAAKFDYRGFTPADGVTQLTTSNENGVLEITVMVDDYDCKDFGAVMFSAKENADLGRVDNDILVEVYYVVKDSEGNKEIAYASGSTTFIT
ncbi:MAG: CehA/McbA family metallohydrolase, partial [Peptococcaceae bacterium]|nr:CehA/McbA family metallohydrolase [Peptococcaceae bacterium]